ncbi:hypothetical protein AGLY_014173 [Aphis glycines]|uniref:PiggyBac transposable element-derived protein domain-containing protein n=1 Tax=Aphis glycines TaxID=307491 RepID=A0A6G0T568_APHGL|nr:hypothetical protein AGLY_014173 [Aphis glycines]
MPDFNILELLGNGQDSDLSSLSGDDNNEEDENVFPTSELDRLLNDFTYFDDDDGNELFPDLFDVDIPTGNDEISKTPTILSPMVNLPFVDKKDIKWDMKPLICHKIDIQQPLPELSTIYKILSPLDYLMNYFPEEQFEKIATYTNIYAKQKNKLNFHDTTSSEIKVFVGVHLLIGCLKHIRIRLYWTSDFRVLQGINNLAKQRLNMKSLWKRRSEMQSLRTAKADANAVTLTT